MNIIRHRALLLILAFATIPLSGFPAPADPCHEDLRALYDLTDTIESLAAFALDEVQNKSKPPSAKQGLQESLDQKIADAAKLSRHSEEEIRGRILRETSVGL